MFIRAYLRASTEDQNADRARSLLDRFVQERGHVIACYYRENISGTKLDRPELKRLMDDGHEGDVLLVEQIDRLTRLKNEDWSSLKKAIEEKNLRIVSLDVPTSWAALESTEMFGNDSITSAVLTAINTMFIDLMAAMARKDYLSRQERQKQGIDQARKRGRYKGRQADQERHDLVLYYRTKGLSQSEIAAATGYSPQHVYRLLKKAREQASFQ